jgi:hypothetical protein
MLKDLDCVLCGSCVADVLVGPVPLESPIGSGRLLRTRPIELATGGIVSNAGVAMARLGMKTAAFTYVGNDDWAELIRRRLEREGLDCRAVTRHPTANTSTSVVLIDASGERSFAHCVGAHTLIAKKDYFDHIDLFARSRIFADAELGKRLAGGVGCDSRNGVSDGAGCGWRRRDHAAVGANFAASRCLCAESHRGDASDGPDRSAEDG